MKKVVNRQNPADPQILELDNVTLLHESSYNNSLKTKFFAHGLNGSPTYSYLTKDGNALIAQNQLRFLKILCKPTNFEGYLEREDCNFIAIDWSTMATGNYSFVATNYVPLAGVLTGKFINFLVNEGATLDDFHLIGHRYLFLLQCCHHSQRFLANIKIVLERMWLGLLEQQLYLEKK